MNDFYKVVQSRVVNDCTGLNFADEKIIRGLNGHFHFGLSIIFTLTNCLFSFSYRATQTAHPRDQLMDKTAVDSNNGLYVRYPQLAQRC